MMRSQKVQPPIGTKPILRDAVRKQRIIRQRDGRPAITIALFALTSFRGNIINSGLHESSEARRGEEHDASRASIRANRN